MASPTLTEQQIHDLKICLKSVIISYVPNAIPPSRILKLVGFILGSGYEKSLKSYGVKKFVEEHLSSDAVLLEGGGDAIIYIKCVKN